MYPFKEIQNKYRNKWKDLHLYSTSEEPDKKYYLIEMWPYTSGNIHIGHFRNYAVGDLIWRWKKMKGHDLLHPFGWDAFGLPAEEAAIKKNQNPEEWTYRNIESARNTIKKLGFSYDWSREIATCDPSYYRWTQWLLIQLFENNLLYRNEAYVNWCPSCKTVLANEQVESGKCWRCDSEVEKRKLEQWFVKTTEYAEELYERVEELTEWPENIREMQRNWIGKTEGAVIKFKLTTGDEFEVFTTRPDTIYGVTFICLSPESEIAEKIADENKNVKDYIKKSLLLSHIERTRDDRVKTGVDTLIKAIHPLTGEKLPVYVADFVLGSYATGIVMGVPAHDHRDYEFAKRFGLPIREVIQPESGKNIEDDAYEGHGKMINSDKFNGMDSKNASDRIIEHLDNEGLGYHEVNYRLNDWLISRQRYWGAPMPFIHCKKCGINPVPFENLPVRLPPPEEVDFIPGGRSPLSEHTNFMKATCPECGGEAHRDPDTADTFIDSSWYHLRYLDPGNDENIFDREEAEKWLPIDLYIGGAEHATGHLIYFRFITRFLNKLGYSPVREPVIKLFNQGMVRDENGDVMSKSKGNVVEPVELIEDIGVDAARIAMLFFGPPEAEIDWKTENLKGSERFLNRIYDTFSANLNKKDMDLTDFFDNELYRKIEKTTRKVSDDIERFSFNTAVAALMETLNEIEDYKEKDDEVFQYALRKFVKLLAPFAPFISEELYSIYGDKESIFFEEWPEYDEKALKEDTFTLVVQVDGKVRAKIEANRGIDKEKAEELALKNDNVNKFLKNSPSRVIYVSDKLINLVN